MGEFLDCLNEFIDVTNSILRELDDNLDWMKGHETRCEVAKTSGTTASVLGSAILIGGLISAPFTGGASVIAATGLGAAIATSGTAVNVATDLADFFTTKFLSKKVNEICVRRKSIAKRLRSDKSQC